MHVICHAYLLVTHFLHLSFVNVVFFHFSTIPNSLLCCTLTHPSSSVHSQLKRLSTLTTYVCDTFPSTVLAFTADWHLLFSFCHTFVFVSFGFFSFLIRLSFLGFVPSFSFPIPLSLLSAPVFSHPSLPHPLPPSLPTVGKWHVVRVLAWTGTPLGAAALPGSNSPAPVVMWISSSRFLPRQHHLPPSLPSTSIRKMDKTPLNPLSDREVHSRDRQAAKD